MALFRGSLANHHEPSCGSTTNLSPKPVLHIILPPDAPDEMVTDAISTVGSGPPVDTRLRSRISNFATQENCSELSRTSSR
ncbi:hypothetical protein AVEN_250507-1 [Araneus ventricosus]|uniref:Uncharacterized protein n=1 Tax=Araneus ventricosus TaxID=182803 RepID=A0A4Y2FHJ5_ARAVE|nr:hypothetical protein AVEN_250507-1 [Araneus ventricosus]